MNNNENLEEMINFIQSFANKSDEEILLEVAKLLKQKNLKNKLNLSQEKLLQIKEALKPLLTPKQQEQLEFIISTLLES